MVKSLITLIDGDVLDEHHELSFSELCRACQLSGEELIELVEHGVIEPRGQRQTQWRFSGVCINRVRRATRLHDELGLNMPGVALALELLDELQILRQRLDRTDRSTE